MKGKEINIDEIRHLCDQEQAEKIADKFTSIPNQFEALSSEQLSLSSFSQEDIHQFEASRMWP